MVSHKIEQAMHPCNHSVVQDVFHVNPTMLHSVQTQWNANFLKPYYHHVAGNINKNNIAFDFAVQMHCYELLGGVR